MRTRLTLFLIVLPAVVWGLFGFFGDRVSSRLTSRFGSRILASGDGKFTDAQPFIKKRLQEGVVLMTAACLLLVVYRRLSGFVMQRLPTPARWIVQGWCAFLCLNVFAAIAAHTVLFWSFLFTGKEHVINYTQYRIKQELLKEVEAPSQALLMGASQTRSQIDTKVLNERMGRRVWTTELHFPGSTPYDMTLCLERLPKVPVDYIITYLSEGYFYAQPNNERLMYFFGFRDLAAYWSLGPGKPSFDRFLICGLLGDIFPLYRAWDSLAGRARGGQTRNQDQERYDASLESDLVSRAQSAAKSMGFGPECGFHKRSFVTFAKMCRERGCRLIVCCGQLNPVLERALNPALRPDMMAFLREQAAEDPNIVLLEASKLPSQDEGDYEDLTHVNLATRARFSQYIADVLEKLSRTKSP